MKTHPIPSLEISALRLLAAGTACLFFAGSAPAQVASPAPVKSFIDYFLPTTPAGPLSKESLGRGSRGSARTRATAWRMPR